MKVRRPVASIGALASHQQYHKAAILTCISSAFKQECRAIYAAKGDLDLVASGDVALTASNFDRSIELYSAVIDLDYATDTIFAKRCKAKLGKMLWGEALLDAQKVR
jgi:hypothetical protein